MEFKDIRTVSNGLMETLVAMLPSPRDESKEYDQGIRQRNGPSFDLDGWIKKHDLKVLYTKAWQGGTIYVLESCPFVEAHGKDSRIIKMASGALDFGCFHDGCQDKGWHDLRDLVEPGWREKRNPSQIVNIGEEMLAEEPERASWEAPIPLRNHTLPDFPIEALSNPLREYVQNLSVATQTPPDLAGMLVLAVCATALAKKFQVEVRDGWAEPLNIFTLVSLPPGERKSAVFAEVMVPVEMWENDEIGRLSPVIAEAQSNKKILEERLRQGQAKAAKASPEEAQEKSREAASLARELDSLDIPSQIRLIADDISPEKTASLLAEQGGKLAVLSAEGGIFDIMAGRYSQNQSCNFEVFLKGHSGDTLRVDRIGRPPEYIRGPALTMGLAVQPHVINGLIEKPGFRGRGLLARFLYSMPASRVGIRDTNPPPLSQQSRTKYDRLILSLLNMKPATDENGKPTPHILKLSSEATSISDQFAAWLEPQMAPHGGIDYIVDWAAKLHGAVARIAGIFHVVNCVDSVYSVPTISGETFKKAVGLGLHLIEHAKAAFSEMGSNGELNDAEYVLRWIEKSDRKEFTKREAHNAMQGKFKTVEALEPALKILQEHFYIRELPADERTGAGRKPSPVFEVNPLSTQYTESTQCPSKSDFVYCVYSVENELLLEENLLEGEL